MQEVGGGAGVEEEVRVVGGGEVFQEGEQGELLLGLDERLASGSHC